MEAAYSMVRKGSNLLYTLQHLGGPQGDPALGAAYPSLRGLDRDRCAQLSKS